MDSEEFKNRANIATRVADVLGLSSLMDRGHRRRGLRLVLSAEAAERPAGVPSASDMERAVIGESQRHWRVGRRRVPAAK